MTLLLISKWPTYVIESFIFIFFSYSLLLFTFHSSFPDSFELSSLTHQSDRKSDRKRFQALTCHFYKYRCPQHGSNTISRLYRICGWVCVWVNERVITFLLLYILIFTCMTSLILITFKSNITLNSLLFFFSFFQVIQSVDCTSCLYQQTGAPHN